MTARAPSRVDLGGGWTDVPPYSVEVGGAVCNVAIRLHATATLRDAAGTGSGPPGYDDALAQAALRRAGLPGLHAELRSEFPQGAGLGGSSAAGVAMAGAVRAWCGSATDDREAIAEESRRIEVEGLGIAGGRQDHYAAAIGGALLLTFSEHGTTVRSLAVTSAARDALERRGLILYTGQSRMSGAMISAVLDAWRAGDAAVVESLAGMKALAVAMAASLELGDLDALGAQLASHWALQRRLSPGITTPTIDRIMRVASGAGALGGKALGASGGGCVFLLAADDAVERLRAAVSALGTVLPFRLDFEGLTVSQP